MSSFFLSLIVAVIFLVAPHPSAGQNGELSELTELSVVVEKLSKHATGLGLRKKAIETQVAGVLQDQIPNLEVKDETPSTIYISINLGLFKVGTEEKGYYGAVFLEVFRKVTITETSRVIRASVWSLNSRMLGPKEDAVKRVHGDIKKLLAQFTADWYRDNPPK